MTSIPFDFETSVSDGDGNVARRRVFAVDGAFLHGGAWAGVEEIVETAYRDLAACGRRDVIDRHDYALHMVLRRHREAIPIRYASLTDLAKGVERTRNFPLDRAYRIVHSLVDLMLAWRALHADAPRWIIAVRRFDAAQNLASRFFAEIARRGAASGIAVIVKEGERPGRWLADGESDDPMPYEAALARAPEPLDTGKAARALADDPALLSDIHRVDLLLPELVALFRQRRDPLGLARIAMRAICLYNHFGYYEESGAFTPMVVDHLAELVGDSEDDRWNYIGNIFQGMVMTGRQEEARALILKEAEPHLTRPDLRSKMHYILGMIDLRYSETPDVAAAELHIEAARTEVARARSILSPEDFAFFSVFKDNGLAFLRVRQGRSDEALRLCLTATHG